LLKVGEQTHVYQHLEPVTDRFNLARVKELRFGHPDQKLDEFTTKEATSRSIIGGNEDKKKVQVGWSERVV